MLNIKYSYPRSFSLLSIYNVLYWYACLIMMVLSSLATCNYGNHNPELSLSASEYEHTSAPRVKKSKHFFFKIFIFIYTIQSSVIYCWIRIIIKTKRKKPTFLSFSLRSHISVNYDFNAMNRGTCKCFVSLFLLWVKRT